MIGFLVQVDVAVVEVGMGGAYDSTNNIPYVKGGKEGGREGGREGGKEEGGEGGRRGGGREGEG